MFIPFAEIPASARLWIYQSNDSLSEQIQGSVLNAAQQFIQTWDSHGRPLKASAEIRHNHFLLIALDESMNPASGCSIDKSVHFLQGLENSFGINLFDRSRQALLVDGEVQFVEVKNLKKAVDAGQIGPGTLTFNNLISTVSQLPQEWIVPAEKSWLARHFRKQPQV